MKAVRIHGYGGYDAPRPKPGEDEVQIRVFASSVNPPIVRCELVNLSSYAGKVTNNSRMSWAGYV